MDKIQKFNFLLNCMRSDIGRLGCKNFDALNSNISEHLDDLSAMLHVYILDGLNDGELCKILKMIREPFIECWTLYTGAYHLETGLKPGNLDEYGYVSELLNQFCKARG